MTQRGGVGARPRLPLENHPASLALSLTGAPAEVPAPRQRDEASGSGGWSLRLLDAVRLEWVGPGSDPRPVALTVTSARLLALLALRGPLRRETAAGRLWPEVTERQARGCLRSALWRLPRGCAGLVSIAGEQLALSPTVMVDVHRLARAAQELLDRGLAAEPAELPGLPTGSELLPGWQDDWVLFERERLRQLRLYALEARADALLARDQLGDALTAALSAVAAEPLRESAHRRVVAVHLAEGNVGEALREYALVRDLLRAELGVDPSPRIRSLVGPYLPDDR